MTARKRLKKQWSLCLRLSENEAVIEQYLAEGGDLNVVHSKTTLLCEACRCGQFDKVQFLLEKGANIDQVDDSGSSPIYIATAHGHGEIVDLLISRGADLNRMNMTRYTPLLTALQNSHYKIAKKLILAGTNVNINKQMPYGFDVSLLNVVLFEKQQWDICEMLIKAGTTPVKFTSPIGYILLEDSGLQLDTAKLLIAAGFNIYVEHWMDQMKKRDVEDITETQLNLLKLLKEDHDNVRSLQSHCRVVIRNCIVHMGRQVHLDKLIEQLPLPTDVKKFLKLEYL